MQIIPIYRYGREGGGVTISPIKPEVEYSEMARIIADDGKVITKDGQTVFSCIDAETSEGWYEIDDKTQETEGRIIEGVTDNDN